MAIKSKLVLANEDNVEREYPEAYFRIQKISTANADYEFFKKVEDPERPDIAEELQWITRYESSALVYVWVDEIARKNRAPVLHWFNFDFDFNDKESDNIYEQAYRKLKQIFLESEDV